MSKDDVIFTFHEGSGTVTKKSGFGTEITLDIDTVIRATIIVRGNGRVMRYLFSYVDGFCSIFVVVFTSKDFT